ncbi:DUF924 family protein [Martelella soudanensis]|uniref:DUF924 family protein n=1 Tax=unclassified Martelella TaxID=2629616 RepID=UPI0015DD6578|nr:MULTISPECIES: DUF924 family protein [unclassified Martelella]
MSEFISEAAVPEQVLAFWFEELTPKDWFQPDDVAALDRAILYRFFSTHKALAQKVDGAWRASPEAQLAAVIVLDQFPRNIYRATPMAFATDRLALREAKFAVASGADAAVPEDRRAFFYMPFEHSEKLKDQKRSVELFKALGNEEYTRFAESHRDVIARFGRFPHRNAILKRRSTPDERRYLSSDENTGWGQK